MANHLRLVHCFAVGLLLCLPSFGTGDDNWPGWRGPRGDGSSNLPTAPRTWDGPSGANIRWKTKLDGEGHSSPIIWDQSVFITACLPESNERVLACLDRSTGTRLWQKTVLRAKLESKHALNSYASSTPATDGELVYVAFLEVNDQQVAAPM